MGGCSEPQVLIPPFLAGLIKKMITSEKMCLSFKMYCCHPSQIKVKGRWRSSRKRGESVDRRAGVVTSTG